jgi:hypothetical protein
LTSSCVVPILKKAVGRCTLATGAGDTRDGAGESESLGALQDVLAGLQRDPKGARRLGITPLFSLAHTPVLKLVRRHGGTLPATVRLNGRGGGVQFPFPTTKLVRRLEGQEYKPLRFVDWRGRGAGWARAQGKVAHDGAGTRRLSHSWADFLAWRPGAYDLRGVPPGWSPAFDGCSVVVGDPGVRLIIATR